jgi:GNAT superfamily N-acetyltransferase
MKPYADSSQRQKSLPGGEKGFLLIKYTGPRMLKILGTVFSLSPGDLFNLRRAFTDKIYYISNIAIYPEFRGLKLGKKLLLKAEEQALNLKKEGRKEKAAQVLNDFTSGYLKQVLDIICLSVKNVIIFILQKS